MEEAGSRKSIEECVNEWEQLLNNLDSTIFIEDDSIVNIDRLNRILLRHIREAGKWEVENWSLKKLWAHCSTIRNLSKTSEELFKELKKLRFPRGTMDEYFIY